MLELAGGTHFLTTDYSSEGRRTVCSFSRFIDVANKASTGFRVSPIFPTNKAAPPKFEGGVESKLIFFGPVFPGRLDFSTHFDIYLTLGTFNVIAWCTQDDQSKELQSFFSEHENIEYEIWTLKGSFIEAVEVSQKSKKIPEIIRLPIRTSEELQISAREYALLISKSISKAQIFWPEQADNLINFDEAFNAVVSQESNDLGRLTDLVLANSALSQYFSQTFSGCSPIQEFECPYAPNSLLGIGLPSQALVKLQDFSARIFHSVQLRNRFKSLRVLKSPTKPLLRLGSSDQIFKDDNLYHEDIETQIADVKKEDPLPLISYFDGTDGFRATHLSLSAPLEAISGANTLDWSLMTLTHEISHVQIEGVLGIIFRDPRCATLAEERLNLYLAQNPSNLYDAAIQLLLNGYEMLHQESVSRELEVEDKQNNDVQKTLTPEGIIRNLTTYAPQVNELLTHVFDFLYFYRQKEDLYINSVWSSWAVIPNIESRVQEYLIRTICAVFSANMDWPLAHSIEIVKMHLEKLADARSNEDQHSLMDQAVSELARREWVYARALTNRLPFVKFVKAFLFSPKIAKALTKETVPTAGAGSKGFRRECISNPLRFLEENVNGHKPAMAKSVWILQHLAFSNEK